ncbi:MAG: ATP-binding protein [Methylacidiphilales bacterium]|nr:ATP-binding protein [Candidatus Methylacidiphilales bacterium]
MLDSITESFIKEIIEEGEKNSVEFKSARTSIDEFDVCKYCCAIANIGGGYFLIGVDDNGAITGSSVWESTYHEMPNKIFNKIKLSVEIKPLIMSDSKKRIIVIVIPSRQKGSAILLDGIRWTRIGSSTTYMDEATLKDIFNETMSEKDYSSEVVAEWTINDLDEEAITVFKTLVEKPSSITIEVLKQYKLITDQGLVTRACLLLIGKKEALDRSGENAEIQCFWHDPISTLYIHRFEIRKPFLLAYEEIWGEVEKRSNTLAFPERQFRRYIKQINEKAFREALYNAFTHRDYTKPSYTRIDIYPDKLTILSPGGFLPDITIETILENKSAHRNKLLGETLQHLKLTERAGTGILKIFSEIAKDGKGLPNFNGSDSRWVELTLPMVVLDSSFVAFIESISNSQSVHLSDRDILELEKIRSYLSLQKKNIRIDSFNKFLAHGFIEKHGKSKDTKYSISSKYYTLSNGMATYSKIKCISRDVKKELIFNFIKGEKKISRKEIIDAFPEVSSFIISNLLNELKKDNKIIFIGTKKSGYWETLPKGASRKNKKELILNHLKKKNKISRKEIISLLPELSEAIISNTLTELKKEQKVKYLGAKKLGYWTLYEKSDT